MTVTNEERCEVAENLRTMTVCGCKYKEQFYELLEEAVMPEWEFHSFDTVADRLADLIEPKPERTCHNFGGEEGTNGEYYDFACSTCGYCCDLPEPNFCPYCGARVVD